MGKDVLPGVQARPAGGEVQTTTDLTMMASPAAAATVIALPVTSEKSLPSTQISFPAVPGPAEGRVNATTVALVLLSRITDWVSAAEIAPAGCTGEIAKLF